MQPSKASPPEFEPTRLDAFLRSALPGLTYVTIAHRASLRNVHGRHFRIEHSPDGLLALHEDKTPPIPPT